GSNPAPATSFRTTREPSFGRAFFFSKALAIQGSLLAVVFTLDKLSIDRLNIHMEEIRRLRKDALFEAIAVMGKALASSRRLEQLELLAQAPRKVDELAQASGQSTANTSQHLQVLHAAGLVDRERDGTRVR